MTTSTFFISGYLQLTESREIPTSGFETPYTILTLKGGEVSYCFAISKMDKQHAIKLFEQMILTLKV